MTKFLKHWIFILSLLFVSCFGTSGCGSLIASDDPGNTTVITSQCPVKVVWVDSKAAICAEFLTCAKINYSLSLSNGWDIPVTEDSYNRCYVGAIYPACNVYSDEPRPPLPDPN